MLYHLAMDSTIVSGNHDIFFRCVEDCFEPIMITDTQGLLVYVNPAWVKTYGYKRDEAIGQSPRILRTKYQDQNFYRGLWQQILDPAVGFWRGELVNCAKDGTLVTVLLTITPYRDPRDPGGPVMGYMGIAVDLTSKKEMEMKIIQQDRLASLGLVASGLAHEVGTPLGVVRGRAELLMMQVEGNENLKKGLETIITQIDRVTKLIRSFLRASRSPQDVVTMPVEFEPLLQEVLTLVNQPARRAGITVKLELPDRLHVSADANLLHQVLLNLLINAVHSIEKEIETSGQHEGHTIKVIGETIGEVVKIRVVDSGSGIAPENLGKLFRPFFTTKDIGKGTGLGLAISAQIVAEMKGHIEAASQGEGKGATFSLILPRA